ncbi:lasso peptide biosynthesis PqqD family chaperone [Allokutzneria sp. A3M-2-11 16]|uniref:lasso peptide biosynthesis PqqD family chaperone n=1 Tax=Allokutzneria sp. A3M-2-11 16 TaxID=2962043 RepID=UPI0020B7BF7C|nr:lasso peptide biosynthesis PqqD family chaperone [Allokutzneria sp. A3M-2-11 16]MCP3803396.1 lasso peptide biosynthesis PqqD family chaperone [Allokutzneria sp. A3M-2-11 16]
MNPTLADHVSTTETDGGMVLLDLRTGHYWQLNATAAAVVTGLRAGTPVDALVTELRLRFPEQAERLPADVSAFVTALRERKLVSS